MDKITREMTFEEEAAFYEKEAKAEFAKETGNGDCSKVNGILRRGMRIIRKARQEIANGVGFLPKWIPVAERLPELKTKVLIYGGNHPIWVNGVKKPMPAIHTGYTRGEDEGWFTWDESYVISNVTHWMPLPEPPKE